MNNPKTYNEFIMTIIDSIALGHSPYLVLSKYRFVHKPAPLSEMRKDKRVVLYVKFKSSYNTFLKNQHLYKNWIEFCEQRNKPELRDIKYFISPKHQYPIIDWVNVPW